MGWLLDRARERKGNLPSLERLAASAWTEGLKGALGSSDALANRLRKLDKREGVEWWTSPAGLPYLEAVAGVIKLQPSEFAEWLGDARPKLADDDHLFHFEVFPGLRPLDLDTEDPFPGIPGELFAGDGPTQRTWWHAPQGAGRTLVARWLVRRHRWTSCKPDSVTELSFIEQDSDAVPDVRGARRVVVASPHPMPVACRDDGWVEVVTPTRWEFALVNWVAERLPDGGLYDHCSAEAFVQRGREEGLTPGQFIEMLADDRTLRGEDAIAPHRRLEAWVRAHTRRADRTSRSASRTYLGEHGADLLRQIEITRLRRGLDVSRDTVFACFPELQQASPDAIQAARDAGDVDGALRLLCPKPKDLVATMLDLRWIIPEGWGFPTRVAGWLRASVIEAVVRGDDITTLGAVVDAPDMALPVLQALATPTHLAASTSRLEAVPALDPETALGLDALVLAMTLSEAQGHAVPEDVRSRLRGAVVRLAGEAGAGVRVRVDPRWWAVAWLSLFPPAQPPTDVQRLRVDVTSQLLDDAVDDPTVLGPLRLLAADRLGDLAATDRTSYRTDLPSSAVADLAADVVPDLQARSRLEAIRRLDVVERLCRRWASTLEEVASLLWPTWERAGVPEDADLARLGCVWATFPPERLRHALGPQLREHIARGVELPEALWCAALEVQETQADALERAPVSVLFACVDGVADGIPAALWRRAPEPTLAHLAKVVETGADAERWLPGAPLDRALEILEVLRSGDTPPAGAAAWRERVISARAEGWRETWKWMR